MSDNQKTVIIHELTACNDITDDNGWEFIDVVVALDHDSFEVVGADISEVDLIAKMKEYGYRVLLEDDEFIHEDRWVRKKTSDDIVIRLQDWQDHNDGVTLTSPSYALSLTLEEAAAEIKRLRAAGDAIAVAYRTLGGLDAAHDAPLREWEETRRG